MSDKPLTDEDFDCSTGWIKDSVQSAKRLLKQKIGNNYPKDIFTPISDKEYMKINELLKKEMGFPIDRVSADLMRIKGQIDIEMIDACFQISDKAEKVVR